MMNLAYVGRSENGSATGFSPPDGVDKLRQIAGSPVSVAEDVYGI